MLILNEEKYAKDLYDGKIQDVKSIMAKIRLVTRYLVHSEQMSDDDILRELLGEEVQSAKNEPQPDGTTCRTENCKRHKDKPLQVNQNTLNYVHDNSRAGSRSEKERTPSSIQRGGETRSHSEQGGDSEEKRKLGRRILVPESIERSVQEGLRAIGLEDSEAKKRLTYTTTAQLQAVLDGRKPAFLEPFPELVGLAYSDISSESNIRYVKASQHCIYNVDAVQKEFNIELSGQELDSFVSDLIDNNKSGKLLGYGYDFLADPRGKQVSITCDGEEISGFDAPTNEEEAEHCARERLKDFVNAFPDLNWSYDIF